MISEYLGIDSDYIVIGIGSTCTDTDHRNDRECSKNAFPEKSI